MKKRILASLLAICMLGTSVFAAGTVVISDSFELEQAIPGFYVSMPEIRAYGANLLSVDGSFETTTSGVTTDANHTPNGSKSKSIAPASGKTTTTYAITIPTESIAVGDVFEIEAYVKSAAAVSVRLPMNPTGADKFASLSAAGHQVGYINAATDWQRVVSRFTIDTAYTAAAAFNLYIEGRWTSSDTTSPLYIDDVKIRKVTNAVQSASVVQAGMPTYPLSALAGKNNAQIVINVKNSTGSAQDLTLIAAYYNADGSLGEVLNVYETSVPASVANQHIESNEFDVSANYTTGDIKIYAWSNAQQLLPYTNVADSEDVYYHKRTLTSGSDAEIRAEGEAFWSTPLPTTDNWMVWSNPFWVTGVITANHTEYIDSTNAKTGVRALYIPSIETQGANSYVGRTFPVEPGHKYKVEFYVSRPFLEFGRVAITGATATNVISTKAKAFTGTWTSNVGFDGKTSKENTATHTQTAVTMNEKDAFKKMYHHIDGSYFETADPSFWEKVTYEFETPAADAMEGEDNYWDKYGRNVAICFAEAGDRRVNSSNYAGNGFWVDDITVTDLGPAE